jgi:Cof subfamily protein (haloacid dehalogenase superfamily)
MKKQIKLIATDLDGTVLNQGEVSQESDIKMFEEVQKRGFKAMAVTGQSFHSASVNSKKFGFDKYFDVLASDNGAYIAKISTHEVLRSLVIDHEVIFQLNEVLIDKADTIFLCTTSDEKVVFVNRESDEEVLKLTPWFKDGFAWKRIADIKENDTIHNMTIISRGEEEFAINKILENHKDSVAWSFDFNQEGNIFYSINHINATKATALEFVAEKFNIGLDEILIFGDGPNDIPMFELIKHSVAPANAVEQVKGKAAHHTDSVQEGGVGNFLKKHLIEED